MPKYMIYTYHYIDGQLVADVRIDGVDYNDCILERGEIFVLELEKKFSEKLFTYKPMRRPLCSDL